MNVSITRYRTTAEVDVAIDRIFDEYETLLPSTMDARIVIKPNHNSNMNALTGNTTDLRVLASILRMLKRRGYHNITIGEGTSSGFYNNRIDVISRLRTAELARRFDVEIIDFNYGKSEEVDFGDGLVADVTKECLEADFFLCVPKIKMHAEAGMTAALKNIVGCLVGLDKRKIHDANYYANILKLNEKIKPHFYIVDGLIAMEGNGPSDGDPVKMDVILAGDDPLLLDLVIARLIGYDYDEVPYLRVARQRWQVSHECYEYADGLDLNGLQQTLRRPNPSLGFRLINNPRTFAFFTKLRYAPLLRSFFSLKPVIALSYRLGWTMDLYVGSDAAITGLDLDESKCDECGVCAQYCPVYVDLPDDLPLKVTSDSPCIGCLYCYCVCPQKAIWIQGELGFFQTQIDRYDQIIRDMITTNETQWSARETAEG